jgi:peptidyl-prolyl cis-trans isomerase B (cyclophilin B)
MANTLLLLLLTSTLLSTYGCQVRVRDSETAQAPLSIDTSRTSAPLFDIQRAPDASTMPGPVETTVDEPPIQAQTNFYEISVEGYGTMIVRLYDETPQHRDNFKRLAAQRFFDGTTFHRVIPGFMIQGGDPNSKDEDPYNDGIGGPGYTVPAEFNPNLIHKRGALAAARQPDQVNPERRSSGSQFYIVLGRVFPEAQLSDIEQGMKERVGDAAFSFNEDARRVYTRDGGAPFLDMQYTVFGELVSGFDTLDRIGQVSTNENDRPLKNVTMNVRPAPGM